MCEQPAFSVNLHRFFIAFRFHRMPGSLLFHALSQHRILKLTASLCGCLVQLMVGWGNVKVTSSQYRWVSRLIRAEKWRGSLSPCKIQLLCHLHFWLGNEKCCVTSWWLPAATSSIFELWKISWLVPNRCEVRFWNAEISALGGIIVECIKSSHSRH